MKQLKVWIKNHKKIVIIFLIVILFLVMIVTFLWIRNLKDKKQVVSLTTIVLKDIKIEVFEEVPKLEDYVVSFEKDGKQETISRLKMEYVDENHKKIDINQMKNFECVSEGEKNCSKVVAKELGTYFVHIYSKQDRIDELVRLHVVDTTAPILKLKEVTIKAGEKYQVTDFVDSCSDNSKKECIVDFKENVTVNLPGAHEVIILAKDESGNITEEKTKLIIQAKQRQSDASAISKKGYEIITKNGITTIDGILIVNKTYSLPSNYGNGLTSEMMNAFNMMKIAASNDGITLSIVSGFRSYGTQKNLYNSYVARDGKEEADTYSARPGHSEHQSGLGFDLNWVDNDFKNTKEGIWLHNNSYKYGFILRYPEGKTNETGYIYEPWHYRYVGVSLAEKLYNGGDWITLEDYFGIDSRYAD